MGKWEKIRLGDVCRLINGRAYKKKELLAEGKYPVLRVGNFFTNKSWYYSDLELDADKYCNDGDLLYAWSASFGPQIWEGGKAIYHYHIWKTDFDYSHLNKAFLYHWFDWDKENIKTEQGVGSTMIHVTKGAMEDRCFTLPPFNEQRRIADKIDTLQTKSRTAREALEKVQPLLEKFRQSLLAAAFRGDLTAEWRKQNPDVEPASKLLERIRAERRQRWEEAELAKMEAKGKTPKNDKWKAKYKEPEPVDTAGLPDLPEGWCWASLEELKGLEINSMTDGPFGSKLKTKDYIESGPRVVRLGNIGTGAFKDDKQAHVSEEKYASLAKHHIHAGDLVIAALAEPVGRSCIIPESLGKALVKADCIRFKPYSQVDTYWLMSWLNSPRAKKNAESMCHGLGRLRINMANIRKLPIPLCPEGEQLEISNQVKRFAKTVDVENSQVEIGLNMLTSLDQSILAKAFRGELVPQDPNDEPASVLLERIKAEREAQKAKGKKKVVRRKKVAK